jgi:hypothetical protein
MRLCVALLSAVSVHSLSAPPKLVRLSKSHHVLSIDDGCDCRTSKCPCDTPNPPPPPTGANFLRRDNNTEYFASPTVDDSDVITQSDFDGYYGYTTQGAGLGQILNATIEGEYVPESNSTNVTPTTTMSSNGTITPDTISITDRRYLTLYKGNDASNRVGNSEYEDVLIDFHNGWSVWPSNVISYQFDPDVSTCVKSVFVVASSVVSDNTCVVFNEVKINAPVEEPNAILRITNMPGCFASLGYSSSGNVMNIGAGCLNTGTAIHLLLHALGLFHEHQRPDRDTFVAVNAGFVDILRMGGSTQSAKFEAVFGKADPTIISPWINATMNRAYDHSSIMQNGPCHYSTAEEFGGDQCVMNPTLTAVNGTEIGNRATLSLGDAQTVGALYNCSAESIREADPIAAVNTDIALCTAMDSADFEWSENAMAARTATIAGGVSQLSTVTTETTTTAPNEDAAFKNFFRDSSRQKILFLVGTGVGIVLILAGVAITAHFNKKKAARRGRRALATSGGGDQITQLLNDGQYGDSTDSEALGEIMDDEDETSPAAAGTSSTPFTATYVGGPGGSADRR